MSDYRTRATVDLDINGAGARKELAAQEQLVKNLRKAYREALVDGDDKQVRKLSGELRSATREMRQMRAEAQNADEVLRRLDTATVKELRGAVKQLSKELNNMPRGSKQWEETAAKLRQVKTELQSVKEEMGEDKSFWEKLGDGVKGWAGGMVAGVATVTGAIALMTKAVTEYADMDQEMANVRKYTGMSQEEVARLNEEFKKMDTRTSRLELNKLAQEAGRLGKASVEDVLGFVRASDQVNVALDELGEGATLEMSKLASLFHIEDEYGTEQSLLKIGSVVNDLSQSCEASAPYIVEFTQRMGAVGASANMTISQIAAFGAVFDKAGVNVEASSTAMSQIITRMMTDSSKYAEAAGLDAKKFADLMKSDVNAALIEFFEAMNRKGGLDQLAPLFADMGENGSNAVKSLTLMSQNIGILKEKQDLANQSFAEGTSIGVEFGVQNETLQAKMEKMQNSLHELLVALGERLVPIATVVIDKTRSIGSSVLSLIKWLGQYKGSIAAIIASLLAYQLAIHATTIKTTAMMIAEKAWAAVTATGRAIRALAIASYHLAAAGLAAMRGQTEAATVHMLQFNVACAASPLVPLIALVTAAVAAFALFNDTTEQSNAIVQKNTEAVGRATEAKVEAEQQMQKDIQRLQEFNGTKEDELRLCNEMNKRYGPVLGTYKTVGQWLNVLKTRGDNYTAAVYRMIMAEGKLEATRQLIAEAAKKREELKQIQDPDSFLNKVANIGKKINNFFNPGGGYSGIAGAVQDYKVKKKQKEIDSLEAAADRLQKEAYAEMRVNPLAKQPDESSVPTTTPTITPGTGGGDDDKKKKKMGKGAGKGSSNKELPQGVKDSLKKISDEFDAQETQLNTRYSTGELEISYEEYLERLRKLRLKYFDDSLALLKKHNATESKEYKDFTKKRKDSEEMNTKEQLKLKKETLKRLNQQKVLDENARYAEYEDPTFAQETEHLRKLDELKITLLKQEQSLYKKTDKEWHDYQYQIEEATQQQTLTMKKRFMAQTHEFRKRFDDLEALEQYKLNKAMLEALLKEGAITPEEYGKWLDALNTELKQKAPGFEETASESVKRIVAEAERELKALVDAGVITQDEMDKRMKRVRSGARSQVSQGKKGGSSSMASTSDMGGMTVDIFNKWNDFKDGINGDTADMVEHLGALTGAAGAVVTSVWSTVSEFQQAEYERQMKLIEKRYSREARLAEGNSFLLRKLENQKEKEIAAMKSKSARAQFAMQVAQTIAQTATNAINAYGAALQVGPAGLTLAPIAAALAVAQGMLQIALIKKQQQVAEQGYAEGGFTSPGQKYTPVGVVHAGEWVAPREMVNNRTTRPLIDALEYARVNNRLPDAGFVRAAAATSAAVPATSPEMTAAMVAVLARLSESADRMNDRLERPFTTVNTVAGEFGSKQANDDYQKMLKNKNPKK